MDATTADPPRGEDLVVRAAAAFRHVFARVFDDDPAANPHLSVEPVCVAEVGGVPTLVLITPWAMNGLIFPAGEGPAELTVAQTARRVFRGDVAPLGVYWSVSLVSDVSRLISQKQARTLAESFAGPFQQAVREWVEAAVPAP